MEQILNVLGFIMMASVFLLITTICIGGSIWLAYLIYLGIKSK